MLVVLGPSDAYSQPDREPRIETGVRARCSLSSRGPMTSGRLLPERLRQPERQERRWWLWRGGPGSRNTRSRCGRRFRLRGRACSWLRRTRGTRRVTLVNLNDDMAFVSLSLSLEPANADTIYNNNDNGNHQMGRATVIGNPDKKKIEKEKLEKGKSTNSPHLSYSSAPAGLGPLSTAVQSSLPSSYLQPSHSHLHSPLVPV